VKFDDIWFIDKDMYMLSNQEKLINHIKFLSQD